MASAPLGQLSDLLAELAGAITTYAAELRAARESEAQRSQARKAMDEAAEQAYHYRNIDARDFPAWERLIVAFAESCKAAGHEAALGESIAHFAALPNKAARYAADVVRQAVEHRDSGTAAAALDVAVRGGFIRDVREAIEGICDRAAQPRREPAKVRSGPPRPATADAPAGPILEAGRPERPLPPAGYMGARIDDERRTISREGFAAIVNLQDSRIKWAIFKKLAENRDVPVAPEAIIALWDAHGVARRPSDGTVNDAISELRRSLKAIGLTIVVKRKVGRLLAELPPPAELPKRRGKAEPTKRGRRKKKR